MQDFLKETRGWDVEVAAIGVTARLDS
jgi:hypothetical protein